MRIPIAAVTLAVIAVAAVIANGQAATDRVKAIYKVTRISRNTVAISCDNGGDPATYPKEFGIDALIVSCGK